MSPRYYRRRLARRPSGAPGRRAAKPVSVEAAVARADLDALDPARWPGSLAAQGVEMAAPMGTVTHGARVSPLDIGPAELWEEAVEA